MWDEWPDFAVNFKMKNDVAGELKETFSPPRSSLAGMGCVLRMNENDVNNLNVSDPNSIVHFIHKFKNMRIYLFLGQIRSTAC